jgi:hypothetical protein
VRRGVNGVDESAGPGLGTSQNRAALAGHLARAARGRSWYSWISSLVLWLLATVLAVLFCNWVVPGFHADVPWGPLGFAVVLAVVGLLLEPLLVAGAVRLGWIGVLLLVFVGQALIVGVATPGPRGRLLGCVSGGLDHWNRQHGGGLDDHRWHR